MIVHDDAWRQMEVSISQFADVSGTASQTVGRIAATMPGAAGVFQDHGVDFCCGGDQTLADAAAKRRSMSMRSSANSQRPARLETRRGSLMMCPLRN